VTDFNYERYFYGKQRFQNHKKNNMV